MKSPCAILVVDLAFGDCGKGATVDFLARTHGAGLVVRFNGGPQAGHNVMTPSRQHHTFSQFGSGTFVPGVCTLLSRFMLIEPYALFNEARHLADLGVTDALDRLFIDSRAKLITPAHQAANRLREIARGANAHGTCGLGVGEAVHDLLTHSHLMIAAGECPDRATTRKKLRAIVDLKREQLRETLHILPAHPKAQASVDTLLSPSWIDAAVDNYAELGKHARLIQPAEIAKMIHASGTVIFEGAQGVLLDERYGFHPHTTWSNTTFANADALLDESRYDSPRVRIGVLRSYFTRHGPGPLVTESGALTNALPEAHNEDTGWQGRFRAGVFDAVAARYALAVAGGVDALAITHLDHVPSLPSHICDAYSDEAHPSVSQAESFIREGGRIVGIRSPRSDDIADMEKLTQALNRCQPLFSPVTEHTAQGFVETIQSALQAPVGIASHGPAARCKQILLTSLLSDGK